MFYLSCYRVGRSIGGVPLDSVEDCLDLEDRAVRTYGPITSRDFTATLFVADSFPRSPLWAPLLQSGFGTDLGLPRSAAPGALLVIDIGKAKPDLFAFAFGPTGRHLLRQDAFIRGYGLRTALNVLYPKNLSGDDADLARIRSMDSKHRSSTILRARVQASEASTFETFDLNRLRDVVQAAVGTPPEAAWGPRIGGGDALNLAQSLTFDEFGSLCRRIESASKRKDYRERFAWVDDMQPVTDAFTINMLEREILSRIVDGKTEELSLAPPEIVDWEHVAGFRYPFDRRRPRGPDGAVTHPDLRVDTLVRGLEHAGELDQVGSDFVRRRSIEAVNANGDPVHRWPIWRTLVAEVNLAGRVYVLDEGEFFLVNRDYLAELNAFVDAIPDSTLPLPTSRVSTHEDVYNKDAAATSSGYLLMDRKTVRVSTATTPIELCDILTADRRLVHVKRHLGSSDLSHLFAQGAVSADLLQGSPEFRRRAQERVDAEAGGRDGFHLFDESALTTRDFEIVYAVIERWGTRRPVDALPFFSKVNLRLAIDNLASRGFRYSLQRIEALL